MAKTIKFNLICDDRPVRTIEDLQENFSVEDVLKYYENGLLLRWLNVRGYSEYAEKVEKIKSANSIEIIKELIRIFDVEADEAKIEEGVYALKFLEENKELCKIYDKLNFKVKNIIDDYQSGYVKLIYDITENNSDAAELKADIAELVSNYGWAFELGHRDLFWKLVYIHNNLAIMCLLMNDTARKYYLPVTTTDEDGNAVLDTQFDSDKSQMYKRICAMLIESGFYESLGENLHMFTGETEGYWKDVETNDKKYMIISMERGTLIRSTGVREMELASLDINGHFVILDGIDYKSNSVNYTLTYMEV